MNTTRLILRNLAYFRAASLAIVAGMAVATAVLVGALMVGDSVRGSLRDIALERLGPVDYALAGSWFFEESLAQRVAGAAGKDYAVVPGVIVTGGASTAAPGGGDADQKRTGDVQIAGLAGDWVPTARGVGMINGETAAALGIGAGQGPPVVFTFPSQEDVPREATVAQRESIDRRIRVERTTVIPGRGFASLFNLAGGQRVPRNAWLPLRDLQNEVDQAGRANVLLVDAPDDHSNPRNTAAALNAALRSVATLGDYGLVMRSSKATGEAMLTARATYLDPPVVEAAERVARATGASPRFVTVNLVNAVTRTPGGGGGEPTTIHYTIAAGVTALDDGRPLGPDEVVLNEETARQLNAQVGDAIRLDFFRRQSGGELKELNSVDLGHAFKVSRIIPISGLGADPSLTPEYRGLTDSESVSDWDPPKELGIVGERMKLAERDNDAYWKKHKASPRLFVSTDVARKFWGGPFGDVTSIRVPGERGEEFARRLRDEIDPARLGLAFRPVKADQLAAAGGSTDFSMLFVGFSFFLIAAAAMLVAMLFRLNIEQRARQFGLLAAVGFAPKQLRRLALAEGMVLAVIGGLVGLAGAVGYTWLMIYGLRTWWVGAVGTTALALHVEPATLATGFLASLAVAFGAVLWGVWRVGRTPEARLLAGAWNVETPGARHAGRVPVVVGVGLALSGLAVLAMVFLHVIPDPKVALAAGALLLAAWLSWLGGTLRPRRHAAASLSTVGRLGVRNASRHTARSVLSVGLIAFAAFTLITVASMRQDQPPETGDPKSGAGGYRLFVQTSVPLLGDLNTPAGRDQLGVQQRNDPRWGRATFTSLRRWAGEDISCLNLTRPGNPTILGVPKSMTDAGRFTFARPSADASNWKLIDADAADGEEVPVIADNETAQYILKLGVGESIAITDQAGRPRKLKLVATLSHSIFQSEMLMSEANFRQLFPAVAGFNVVLAETAPEHVRDVQQLLNAELEPYAASVDTTAARLLAFLEVQNTYLSTFQALGSLGLALGTIGLAVVLVRNVIERRPELALLSAIGFRPGSRVRLVLSENAFLLVLGVGVGAACALLGIVPTVVQGNSGVALGPLALTLVAVLAVGFAASAVAVWLSGARATPADLRNE